MTTSRGLGTCKVRTGPQGVTEGRPSEGVCAGPLCVTSRTMDGRRESTVACERCGVVDEDHPLMSEMRDYAKKAVSAVPPAPVTPPADYGHSLPERVLALERRCAALEAALSSQAAAVSAASARPGAAKRA